jgi:bifunctional UDP-N-acetylglucosamine pyrophosphorylase/glucosamine-1-phosphate N-acetyltransferase
MPTSPPAGIILAAGKGTRMKSDLPKGLHRVGGLPMVEHIARAMRAAGVDRVIVVIGHGGELLQQALGEGYEYVWQHEQKGTGHAALMAREALQGHDGAVIVAPGDAPLLDAATFSELLRVYEEEGAACVLATALLKDPTGYGRIVRDGEGRPTRIVEQKDASPSEVAIDEICTSVYAFRGPSLFEVLPGLSTDNAQGEQYLTDTVAALAERGETVAARVFDDPGLLVGVNDRWQLALAESDMRIRILRRHALEGVTLLDPATITIGPDVTIGRDTVIEPSTVLLGSTIVGAGCRLGPNTRIEDSQIGDGSVVLMSHVSEAVLGRNVRCGPFANLRPKSILGDGVKVGDFVEVKNATLGEGASVSHLTYIGDARIGARTNVGAGTITCNYDGFQKHQTEIGADVFVGSNSTLVAPVKIGDGAMTAAGSVVNADVPADALAVGRARQEVKEGWAASWRRRKSGGKT